MMKILVLIVAIIAICNANYIKDSMLPHINRLTSLKENFDNAKNGFENMRTIAKLRHEEIENLYVQVEKESIKRAPTQECITAYLQFVNATSDPTCRGYFVTYINPIATTTDRSNAVNSFCSTCVSQYRTAINALIAACPVRSDVPDNIVKLANAVGFYGRFLCAQDSNKNYCSNVISTLNVNTLSDLASVTDNDLKKVCVPCVQISLGILASGVGFNSDIQTFARSLFILKAVCVQVQGQFCLPKLKAANDLAIQIGQKFQQNQTITANDFVNMLNVLCSPCYRLLAARISFAGASSQLSLVSSFSDLGFLCRKNPQREFCIAKVYDSVQNIILSQGSSNPCGSISSNATTCPTECANFVKNLISKGGCCWGILVDAIAEGDLDARRQILAFMTACNGGVAPPPPCPSFANATLLIKYNNLLVEFVNNNRDKFLAAVKQDIIEHYTCNVLTLNYTVSNTRAQTIAVSATTTTEGSAAAVYSDNNLVCSSTCNTVPPNDPSQEVTVSTSASDVKVESSSSLITFNLLIFAFVLLLKFF